MNILAKNVRFRGEFGFYTWFSFIVNGKIAPETNTKNSIFVIRKIRMVIVSSLSGIRETINMEKHWGTCCNAKSFVRNVLGLSGFTHTSLASDKHWI